MGDVALTHLTQRVLKVVRIYHKNFLGIYVGGITYRTEVGNLNPGETMEISLDHYVAGYSKIVRIEE